MLEKKKMALLSLLLLPASTVLTHCTKKEAPDQSSKGVMTTDHGTAPAPLQEEYHFAYDSIAIGGQVYRTFVFNGKRWMIDNLNYEIRGSWCYDENPVNCQKYGRLYTWESAQKACAKVGWRLPTDQEWHNLVTPYEGEVNGSNAAYHALVKGGSSGFEAVLGGFRFDYGAFDFLNGHGYYWSSSEEDPQRAWAYDLFLDYERLFRIALYKNYGYSCRCLTVE